MDIFESYSAKPMLIAENKPAFNSPDYIYELKFDGIRALAYLDDKDTTIINKRGKNLNHIFPELKKLHLSVRKRCILDGEIAVFINGKPNFSSVQARSLMSNPFKIELACKKAPACFVTFDILYHDGEQITGYDLMKRKSLLNKVIKEETGQFALSKFIEEKGLELYQLAEREELEGIVAKKKSSLYFMGKEKKVWIKCKNLLDEDFIVCGYYFKAANFISVILGSYDNDNIIYRGHVVMGLNRQDFKIMEAAQECTSNIYNAFPEFDNARFLEPILKCNVEFMEYTKNGGLRQPVFRGLRVD